MEEDATEAKGGLKTINRETSVEGKPRFVPLVFPGWKRTSTGEFLGRLQ